MLKIATFLVSCTALLLSTSVLGATYQYTAKVRGSVKTSGLVVASGIKWQCGGDRCTTSGPWPTPGVNACQALAQKVGEIVSYGHQKEKLSGSNLKRCNQGVVVLNVPKLSKPVAGLAQSNTTPTAKSNPPLAINKTDVGKLQALSTAPKASTAPQSTGASSKPSTSAETTLPAVQSPGGDLGDGKVGAIPPLDRKLGEPGMDRDELRNIAQDKRQSLSDLKGGSLSDFKGSVQPLSDLPLNTGKQSSIDPEPLQPQPLQPLKGDSIALRDPRLKLMPKSEEQSGILPLDRPTGPLPSSDKTLQGNLPSGSRIIEKNDPSLQISKNIDIGTLQPLDSTILNKSSNITKPGTDALPTIKGLAPPAQGLKPPSPSSLTPDLVGPSAEQRKVLAAAGSTQNLYTGSGPYIDRIEGFDQCVESGDSITLHGRQFGNARDGRRVMLARVGRTIASLVVTQWTDTRISARLPTFSGALRRGVPYQVAIRDSNDRTWLSNANQGVVACSGNFTITGFINFSNTCTPAETTISALRAPAVKGAAVSNNAVAQTRSTGGSPALAGQHYYRITLKSPGTYRVRVGEPPRYCAGRWQREEFLVNVPRDYGQAQQDFRFLDASQGVITGRLGFDGVVSVELTMVEFEQCRCPFNPAAGRRICTPFNDRECVTHNLSHSVRTTVTLHSGVRNCSIPDVNVKLTFYVSSIPTDMSTTLSVGGCIDGGRTRTVTAEFPGVNYSSGYRCWGSNCRYSKISPGNHVRVDLSLGNLQRAGELTMGTSVLRTVPLYFPAHHEGRVYAGRTSSLRNSATPSSQVGGVP